MPKTAVVQPPAFEPEFVEALKTFWQESISFNKVLGLVVESIQPTRVTASLEMRKELVGHRFSNRIHGGVISASLDALGGMAVMAALSARHMDEAPALRMQRFSKVGTIDLRIDYLRPGIGERFKMHAEVLRLGSRVASVRMEFLSVEGKLLSTGSAAYMVS